ncbi:hypothetical protein HYR99_20130 [Candidatus Poribacteria bacterium]|nr:hypothetical protein [Candidatus Poribacteria bacterium]
MSVVLEAIKLNHDPTSATTDALNIRRNASQFVAAPEWQRGISVNPEDSPAAYSIRETQGNTMTIQARFRRTDPNIQAAEVRAFGRVGVQVCFDVCFSEGWEALAAGEAELVLFPSDPPCVSALASFAYRNASYIVASTPDRSGQAGDPPPSSSTRWGVRSLGWRRTRK